MEDYLISIITPVYNGAKYLDEAIRSILSQTYKNIELILINDGSKDESAKICRKWAEADARIVFIDKENEGAAVARNIGLDISKGQLIGFVDQDDVIDKQMYEIMINDIIQHDADIVMCNSKSFNKNGIIKKTYDDYDEFEIDNVEIMKRMLQYEKIFCSSVWSKLYRKNKIGNIRFAEEIFLGDDYYFNGMIYPRINKMYYNNKPLYYYRVEIGSMTRSNIGEHFFDKYNVSLKLEKELERNDFVEDYYLQNFKLAVLYEIVYNLCVNKADKKTIFEWTKRFKTQYYIVKNVMKIPFKNKIRLIMLSNMPKFYVNCAEKRKIKK